MASSSPPPAFLHRNATVRSTVSAGRAVFAARGPVRKGEIVVAERAFAIARADRGGGEGGAAAGALSSCAQCLRNMALPEDIAAHVTGRCRDAFVASATPSHDVASSSRLAAASTTQRIHPTRIDPIRCDTCSETFCSVACRQVADVEWHGAVCASAVLPLKVGTPRVAFDAAARRAAVKSLLSPTVEWLCGGIDYGDMVRLAFRVCCRLVQLSATEQNEANHHPMGESTEAAGRLAEISASARDAIQRLVFDPFPSFHLGWALLSDDRLADAFGEESVPSAEWGLAQRWARYLAYADDASGKHAMVGDDIISLNYTRPVSSSERDAVAGRVTPDSEPTTSWCSVEHAAFLEKVRQRFVCALGTSRVAPGWELLPEVDDGASFLSRLLGRLLLNSHNRDPPTIFATCLPNIREHCYEGDAEELQPGHHNEDEERQTALRNHRRRAFLSDIQIAVAEGHQTTGAVEQLGFSGRGTGLFPIVGCCMNHTCEPNCASRFWQPRQWDHDVAALGGEGQPASHEQQTLSAVVPTRGGECEVGADVALSGVERLLLQNFLPNHPEQVVADEERGTALYGSVPGHILAVVALRDVAAGEELSISYVDEAADVRTRQHWLHDRYHFACTCRKCKEERSLLMATADGAATGSTSI